MVIIAYIRRHFSDSQRFKSNRKIFLDLFSYSGMDLSFFEYLNTLAKSFAKGLQTDIICAA